MGAQVNVGVFRQGEIIIKSRDTKEAGTSEVRISTLFPAASLAPRPGLGTEEGLNTCSSHDSSADWRSGPQTPRLVISYCCRTHACF